MQNLSRFWSKPKNHLSFSL